MWLIIIIEQQATIAAGEAPMPRSQVDPLAGHVLKRKTKENKAMATDIYWSLIASGVAAGVGMSYLMLSTSDKPSNLLMQDDMGWPLHYGLMAVAAWLSLRIFPPQNVLAGLVQGGAGYLFGRMVVSAYIWTSGVNNSMI
jgi:hypothetical protein